MTEKGTGSVNQKDEELHTAEGADFVSQDMDQEAEENEVWKQAEELTKRLKSELEQKSNTGQDVKKEPGIKSAPETSNQKKKKKRTAASYAISFFIKIAVTALVLVLLLNFVVGLYVNHSNSSYPMLKDGDLCLTYRLATLVKGDEIAYERDETIRFGRIVGTEGDVVDIIDGSITINGYGVFEEAVYPTTAEGATISFPYTVPKDTVFVLNDYRSDTKDSRCYGGIPLKDTRGKIILLLRKRGI